MRVNLSIFAPASFAILTFELQSKATPSITDLIKCAFVVVGLTPKNNPVAVEFQLGESVLPKYGNTSNHQNLILFFGLFCKVQNILVIFSTLESQVHKIIFKPV